MSVRIDGNLLLEILEETPATQNIMLMGKHGIGKSQILEKFYTAKGCKVVSLFLGQMSDPGDLIGIPHKNEETGHTEFMPPYWFPTDSDVRCLVFTVLHREIPGVGVISHCDVILKCQNELFVGLCYDTDVVDWLVVVCKGNWEEWNPLCR